MKPFSQGIHGYFICIFLIIFGAPNILSNKGKKRKKKREKGNDTQKHTLHFRATRYDTCKVHRTLIETDAFLHREPEAPPARTALPRE
jgi:hypothetical protein